MKIFGIGLSKTGTTSLARALQMLGYSVKDNLGVANYTRGDLSAIERKILDANEAFTDTPIPSFYRELDAEYPNSKFILTVRDANGWLASCKKQFNQKLAAKQSEAHKQLFIDLYGCTVFDERKFKNGYENFVKGVLEHFQERPQDLLILDIAAGESWEKLCPFLGRPIPDRPFPKANVTQIRWMSIKEVIAVAREAGKQTHADRTELNTRNKRVIGIVRVLLSRATSVMRGGNAGVLRAISKRAYKVIKKRLNALDPNVPVISAESDSVAFSERGKWNHFWLVDPVDSDEAPSTGGAEFTVNIALIEDRQPIVGVVHAPATDTTYYAMAGKKAFKVEGGGEPRILGQKKAQEEAVQSNACFEKREATQESIALGMCLAAEGKRGINVCLTNTMEWQTAAAHAILNCAGMTVKTCSTNNELIYNKEDLANGPIIID